jgi:hypothetical protein
MYQHSSQPLRLDLVKEAKKEQKRGKGKRYGCIERYREV